MRNETSDVPPRVVRILLLVLAIAVLLWIVGYFVFNFGGSTPGSGTGDTITEPTP